MLRKIMTQATSIKRTTEITNGNVYGCNGTYAKQKQLEMAGQFMKQIRNKPTPSADCPLDSVLLVIKVILFAFT